jgi:hypothetical protein
LDALSASVDGSTMSARSGPGILNPVLSPLDSWEDGITPRLHTLSDDLVLAKLDMLAMSSHS